MLGARSRGADGTRVRRVVLLHGPPGTGKTSLCRALAQKLAIRLSDRYVLTVVFSSAIILAALATRAISRGSTVSHSIRSSKADFGTQVRTRQARRDQLALALLQVVLRVRQARPALVRSRDRHGGRRERLCSRSDRCVLLLSSCSCRTTLTFRTDEVESLTAARAGAMEGKEPSDALRVRLCFSSTRLRTDCHETRSSTRSSPNSTSSSIARTASS